MGLSVFQASSQRLPAKKELTHSRGSHCKIKQVTPYTYIKTNIEKCSSCVKCMCFAFCMYFLLWTALWVFCGRQVLFRFCGRSSDTLTRSSEFASLCASAGRVKQAKHQDLHGSIGCRTVCHKGAQATRILGPVSYKAKHVAMSGKYLHAVYLHK